MANIPLAVQLYSVRKQFAENPSGTLREIAQMGYKGVEFAGKLKHKPEELQLMLKSNGLQCCGWHTPYAMVQDDSLEETIEINKKLGNKYLIVPGIPSELCGTAKQWREQADFFNHLSSKLAKHNLRTGYHNHTHEFTTLDGEVPWNILFNNTRQDVIMQLDTGNALAGGADVLSILQRFPERAETIHLKPYTLRNGQEEKEKGFRRIIGQDNVPWHEVFTLCETQGITKWYIVEYESDAFPPMEAIKKCMQALRHMGKLPAPTGLSRG